MSFDYYLTVPSEKWPTFDQLQAALDQDGLGITLDRPDGLSGSHAFSNDEADDSFGFMFRGSAARPGGWLTSFAEDDFRILEDSFEPYRAHEVVEIMFQNGLPINVGDKLCHISFWESDVALGVWWYVCASFVKHFGATYFDPQGDGIIGQESLLAMAGGFCPDPDLDKVSSAKFHKAADIATSQRVSTIVDRIRKFFGLI